MSDESVIRSLELTGEALKYHLLAEAIRAGSKLRKQCADGYYFSLNSSCAIGAAWQATGHKPIVEPVNPQTLVDEGYIPRGLRLHKVYNLNDSGWTREAIADRLDDVAYGRIAEF